VFRMTMDPDKSGGVVGPDAALTMMEQMGLACKEQRRSFTRPDGTCLGSCAQNGDQFSRSFTSAPVAPRPTSRKDLEAVFEGAVIGGGSRMWNLLPMKVRAHYFPATGATTLAEITLQFDRKSLQFRDEAGVSSAVVDLYARVTTVARHPVTAFEGSVRVDVPTEMLGRAMEGHDLFRETLALRPGKYRLMMVAKDIGSGKQTVYEMLLDVPKLEEGVLGASSVMVADVVERAPATSIRVAPFVIGKSIVRPKMDETFKQDATLGIYFQVYNFETDEKDRKPRGTIQYEFYKAGTNERIGDPIVEDVSTIEGGGASQVTVEHLLPLKDFAPGNYTLKIKIVDSKRNQTVNESANFTVTGA
jgi:hypothetical protein